MIFRVFFEYVKVELISALITDWFSEKKEHWHLFGENEELEDLGKPALDQSIDIINYIDYLQ